MKKETKKYLGWGAGIAAVGILWLGAVNVAVAGQRKSLKAKGVSEIDAVDQAINTFGLAAHPYALTDFAYTLAYPDCPTKLDPNDPSHNVCIGYWLVLLEKVKAKQGDIIIAEIDPDSDTISEDIVAFMGTLTQEQQEQLRELLGSDVYDPLVAAAQENNDVQVRAHLLGLQRTIEELIADNPLQAWKLHTNLKEIFGENKLEEFLKIVS